MPALPTATERRAIREADSAIAAFYFALTQAASINDIVRMREQILAFEQQVQKLGLDAGRQAEDMVGAL